MEQPCEFTRLWIPAAQVCPLVIIAGKARQGQIVRLIGVMVFLGNDMFGLKGQFIELLFHMAVFAAVARAFPNQPSQGGVHPDQEDARDRRALDLSSEIKCPTRS